MTAPGGNVIIDCTIEVDDQATPAMKNLNKAIKSTNKSAEQLEKTLSRAAVARDRSIAKATQVSGVYGTAGTNAFSKYRPKGFAGLQDKISTSNAVHGVFGPGGTERYDKYIPRGFGATPVDKLISTSNAVHGVYGKGGTNQYSGYQPTGFSGRGSTVDKIQKTFGSIGESNSKIQKWNKSFFKFQMATLGLSFSFMGLESAATGLINKLGDLSGIFSSNALGKKFGGVDVAAASGTSNADLVQGWKNFQGIMGMVDTTLRVIAANMLTPEVMAALAKFFQDLAPVMPQLGKALGDVLLNAVKFLDALIPLVPVISKIIDIFSPILGPLAVLIIVLGSLLPLLSIFGYIFAAIEVAATVIAPLAGALVTLFGGISLPMIAIAGVAVVLVDFFINLWKAFSDGGDIISNFYQALWQTWQDIAALIKTITFGVVDLTSKSNSGVTTSSSVNTTNNTYNIANLNTNSSISTLAVKKNTA